MNISLSKLKENPAKYFELAKTADVIVTNDAFEDAVIAACAERINADCVVSRDENFINAGTAVEVITPRQLISQL